MKLTTPKILLFQRNNTIVKKLNYHSNIKPIYLYLVANLLNYFKNSIAYSILLNIYMIKLS